MSRALKDARQPRGDARYTDARNRLEQAERLHQSGVDVERQRSDGRALHEIPHAAINVAHGGNLAGDKRLNFCAEVVKHMIAVAATDRARYLLRMQQAVSVD